MEVISRAEAKSKGVKYYFTGKPCGRGGVAERKVGNRQCLCEQCQEVSREAARARSLRYHHENRNACLERSRRYYHENREERLGYQRRYYNENRESRDRYLQVYKERNKERFLEYARRSRERHRDQRREESRRRYKDNYEYEILRRRRYREENREKVREGGMRWKRENPHANAKRRAAKLQRTISKSCELTELIAREAYLAAKEREEVFDFPWHVDHMLPLQGKTVSGLHVGWNLQVIPAHLNIAKGNLLIYTEPLEWLKDMAHQSDNAC